MKYLKKLIRVGKAIQPSEKVLNDFRDKKINSGEMEHLLEEILLKVKAELADVGGN